MSGKDKVKSGDGKMKLVYPENLHKQYVNFASFQITGNELNIDIGYNNSHNIESPETEVYERLILSREYMKTFSATLSKLIVMMEKNEKEHAEKSR